MPSQAAGPRDALATPRPSFKHIRELDGLRGIAALMVFFHHVSPEGPQSAWPLPIRLFQVAATGGLYGVDLFFVLSGFLITSLLIEARDRPYYYHDFYWKRALRILPLYLLCLLYLFLYFHNSGGTILVSLFFLANFSHLFHIDMAGPFWTLAIEEQFYLLWPTVVHRRSIRELRHWAVVIGGGAVVLRLIAAAFGHHDYAFTFFHCDGLASGAFLACWFHGKAAAERMTPAIRRLLGLVMLGSLILMLLSHLPATGQRVLAFEAASLQTGVTLMAGSIIAWLIGSSGRSSVALFRSPVLTFFGLISYALYMTHAYVLSWYDQTHRQSILGDPLAYAARIGVILGFTVVLCLITRYAIELPVISLRRFVLVKPAPPNPHPTPEDPPIPLGNM